VATEIGETREGALMRYIPRTEIEDDPGFIDALMEYVVQESLDRRISRDILGILEGRSGPPSRTVTIHLNYGDRGVLKDAEIRERSGNAVFDEHVLETILAAHKDLSFPSDMREADIVVRRANALLAGKGR
jgi:hypothetical protein